MRKIPIKYLVDGPVSGFIDPNCNNSCKTCMFKNKCVNIFNSLANQLSSGIIEEAYKDLKGIAIRDFNPEKILLLDESYDLKSKIYKFDKSIYYSILNWSKLIEWYNKYHTIYNNPYPSIHRDWFPQDYVINARNKLINLGINVWSDKDLFNTRTPIELLYKYSSFQTMDELQMYLKKHTWKDLVDLNKVYNPTIMWGLFDIWYNKKLYSQRLI